MILDKRNEFCDAVALNTGAAGTYVIGDQIDLGVAARDVGNGEPLYVVIEAATGINAAGAGTVQFQLVSADNAALTTNPVVRAQSAALVTSTTSGNAGGALATGTTVFAVSVPMEGIAYKRYLGIRQVTGSNAITAGAVDAFLTHTVANWKAYDAPFQL
jgi:hypothetical protein